MCNTLVHLSCLTDMGIINHPVESAREFRKPLPHTFIFGAFRTGNFVPRSGIIQIRSSFSSFSNCCHLRGSVCPRLPFLLPHTPSYPPQIIEHRASSLCSFFPPISAGTFSDPSGGGQTSATSTFLHLLLASRTLAPSHHSTFPSSLGHAAAQGCIPGPPLQRAQEHVEGEGDFASIFPSWCRTQEGHEISCAREKAQWRSKNGTQSKRERDIGHKHR